MPAPDDWLARPLWVIDAGRPGAFAPVAWRDDLGLAGMAFTRADGGATHLERLRRARPPAGAAARRRAAVRLLELPAHDPRAREEWLRAVLASGAARVGFDLDPARPDPAAFELTGALLAEVLGTKRGLACL